ncbi:MAG: isocitrate/isopropylmalate family dehydrogenase [Candidatus Calescibacterium sp.]|nr:isocitrate/isopropylmalate family dehydrogenase [Candidatus Calescibacterium sp.]MCX7972074.1 isocitrate/isopropylmalate family dehydrogenase [bacterium]MDW8194641.1 isocitrate/isopropylmalate family dehydrogenase [Candidatus Calescibacterium sp.]
MKVLSPINLEEAKNYFEEIILDQLKRIESIKQENILIDFTKLRPIKIGFVYGDGIGPYIVSEARRLLSNLLEDELKKGNIIFEEIEGLTLERRIKEGKAVPDDVLQKILQCNILIKGPTTTPKAGQGIPNIESANVALRRILDLFANVRPVRVPQEKINWVFFRENTEDLYTLGSQGIEIENLFGIDFRIISFVGSYRIIKMAFEYAKNNGFKRVTAVNKANVIKTTDGIFLRVFYDVAKDYPDIEADDWFIDIMTAKLLDKKRRSEFQVFVLPNLFGDILTDEAAEIQGGVGTAGSANIGSKYAMFEAIHGSAPRMVEENRQNYADPSSIIKASSMMLEYIGFSELAKKIDMALDIALQFEKKVVITGRSDGATTKEFTDYLLSIIQDKDIKNRYLKYI